MCLAWLQAANVTHNNNLNPNPNRVVQTEGGDLSMGEQIST